MHEGGGEGLFLKGLHYHQEQDGPRRHQICWCRHGCWIIRILLAVIRSPAPHQHAVWSRALENHSINGLFSSGLGIRSFDLSILFRSFRSLKKIDRAWIGLVDLWKRSTVSESTRRSLKKSDEIFTLVVWVKRSQITSVCFWQFLPLFLLKEIIATVDLRSWIFFKDRRDRFALVNLWKRSKSKNNQFPEVYVSYCMVMCIV